MEKEPKKITLHDTHVALGAKIVPFAGFAMPVRYSSDKEEHQTVRERVGVFDVSHMGEFLIKGPHALALIQKITSNDASSLRVGQAQYAYFPNESGGIVDDLLVYKLDEELYMLVVNASNIEKDWQWICLHNTMGATLEDVSDELSLFAIQGPLALKTLQKLTSVNLEDIPNYHFTTGPVAGKSDVIISATGYTGAGGFELYCQNSDAKDIWDALFQAGEEFSIKPIGLGARDTLRLEMGFCLYGNDIDDTTSPIEAGLGWITKFTKDFVNADFIKQQKETGVERKLAGFKLTEKGIPRSHYPILNNDGDQIGEVTSGTLSPTMDVGIGLGYVKTEYAKPGTEIFIGIRNKKAAAVIEKLPLLKK